MIGQSFYEDENWQITNFDMGFQKNNTKSRNKIVDFLERSVFSRSAT
jgi:hypothetical protein